MALLGTEIVEVLSPDGAGNPAAIKTPYAAAQFLAGFSVSSNLTALGTNQATALVLAKQFNHLATVAASTGVVLPPAAGAMVGQAIIVNNAGANIAKVYGAGSDTIDGTAGATGVHLTNAKRCIYYCIATGVWVSSLLGAVSA